MARRRWAARDAGVAAEPAASVQPEEAWHVFLTAEGERVAGCGGGGWVGHVVLMGKAPRDFPDDARPSPAGAASSSGPGRRLKKENIGRVCVGARGRWCARAREGRRTHQKHDSV